MFPNRDQEAEQLLAEVACGEADWVQRSYGRRGREWRRAQIFR